MEKHKFFQILFLNIFILLLLGLTVFIIDPYQQYRKPFYNKTVSINQFAINPGLLKHYDYDSIIIGSSMSQNFISEEANTYLKGNFINISMGGATANEIISSFNFAKKQKNIKKVLINLDLSYATDTSGLNISNLDFLYNKNEILNYKYFFNINTWIDILKIFIKPQQNIRDLPFYGHKFQYNKSNTLKSYLNGKEQYKSTSLDSSSKKLEQIIKNNWIKLICENPNTEFILFFPPYSILTYKLWGNSLTYYLKVKETLITNLLPLKNVKIYDFQHLTNITYNLDNYKDFSHYHPNINSLILKEISNKNYQLNFNNYSEYISQLKDSINFFEITFNQI